MGPTAVVLAVITCVQIWSLVAAAPSAAVADSGGADPLGPGQHLRYQPPVRAPVVDPFRAPRGPYGPGNRGLEYRTQLGQPVRSIGAGVVVFAGPVAGRLVVSIDHPDGLRSSLVGLAAITVVRGQLVAGGVPVGRAAQLLHLGVRRSGSYLDPALLFAATGPARLVPMRSEPGFGGAGRRH